MSYQAIVTKVALKPHPKADRLMLADVAGHQLVCAADAYSDGDTVVFFPTDGELSHELCYHNNLYRENKGENKDPGEYGYFDSNRRVQAIKLRGEKSEGFMMPLSSLAWTGYDLSKLKPGLLLDTVGEYQICKKYETKATQQARAKAGGQAKKDIPEFAKVGDTGQFKFMMNSIPDGAVITVSEKIHGTSGRTGLISVVEPVPQKWWERLLRLPQRTNRVFKLVSGSRNQIIAIGKQVPIKRPDGTEVPFGYRQLIHNSFEGCLYPGESIFYEIVVCNDDGIPDFRHTVPKDEIAKPIQKQYGDKMYYRYGVEPGKYGIFIYRITMQNEQGNAVQLSWNQMVRRANELGVPTVPQLDQLIYRKNPDALKTHLSMLSVGSSTLDSTHIREGVVAHVDHPQMLTVLKYKGFEFCHLEGIAKNDNNYVDVEEIA